MKYWQKGFGLIEVIVAVALFAVIASSSIAVLYAVSSSTKQGTEYVAAAGLIQEGVEAVRSIRARNYAELVSGTHGLQTTSGYYEFNGTSDSILSGVFTRTITIDDVYRDGSNDIAVSGTLDSNTRKVTVNVTWDTLDGKTQNIDSVFYVYNFAVTSTWVQTLTADFTSGFFNSAGAQAGAGNGEVVMDNIVGDWSTTSVAYLGDTDGTGDSLTYYFDDSQNIFYTLTQNTSGSELTAWDSSDVSQGAPTIINSADSGGFTLTDFAVQDGYAYVTTQSDSYEVGVARLSDMTTVNSIDLGGAEDAYSVVAFEGKIAIGRQSVSNNEVVLYDVTTPESTISLLNSVAIGASCLSIDTDGSYLYCGTDSDTSEIVVIRISDFSVVNTVNLAGTADVNDVTVSGTRLYVGLDDGSTNADFYELNISTPESTISTVNSLDTSSNIEETTVDYNGSFAFLASSDTSGELIIVDLGTGSEVNRWDVNGSGAFAIAQFGSYVAVGGGADANELTVFTAEQGGWKSMQSIGAADISGALNARKVLIDGNYAYIITDANASYRELYIYDISTPSSPTLLSSLEIGLTVNDMEISGNYLYIGTTNNTYEIRVVNVTTKTSPSLSTSYYNATSGGDVTDIEISGNYLYFSRLTSTGNELYQLNIASAPTMSLVASANATANINGITISGSYMLFASSNDSAEFFIQNLSGGLVGSLNLSGTADAQEVRVYGNTVVVGRVSSTDPEIAVIDISTPSSPTLLGSGEVGATVTGLAMDTDQAVFVTSAATNAEIERWDISTPASPVIESSYDLNGTGLDVAFDGTYAYVANDYDSSEFQILGPITASDYPYEAIFTSQAYDSGSASASWSKIEWTASTSGTTVTFRLRTASSEAGLATARWVGSDGTSSTSYSTSGATVTTDPNATGTEWVQWQATFTGPGSSTASLQDVTLTYAE